MKYKKGQVVRCLYDLEHGLRGLGETATIIPEGTIGVVLKEGLTVSGTGIEVFWQGIGKKIFMFDDQIEPVLTAPILPDSL